MTLYVDNKEEQKIESVKQDDLHIFPFFNIPIQIEAPKSRLAYWEDFLTQEEISILLNLPEWKEVNDAKIGGGSEGVINKNIRRSKTSWVTITQETDFIFRKILSIIANINVDHFGFHLSGGYEKAQLSLYTSDDSGNYDWHIDAGINDVNHSRMTYRKLSMSLLLSDPNDFEGGQLQIKTGNDEVTLESKQGRAWFFPSFLLHRVTPVTKGVRKSIVLWIGGPHFK